MRGNWIELTPMSVSKVQSQLSVQSRDGVYEGRLPWRVESLSHHYWLFWGSTSRHVPGSWMNTLLHGGEPQVLRLTGRNGRLSLAPEAED